jgi:putative ABC transport system permease protein
MSAYLAFKELWRNKGRFFLVGVVIALITTLVLFIAALAEGLGNGNKEYIEKLDADLILYQRDSQLSIAASRISRSKLAAISRVEGVRDVGSVGTSSASIVLGGNKKPLNVSLIGVEPGKPGAPPAFIGNDLKGKRGEKAVIDRNVALRVDLKVGDEFTIRSVQGTDEKYYTLEVVGVSDGRQYSLQPSVFVPYLTWDKLKPKPTVDDNKGELISNVVAVQVADPSNLKVMIQRIESQVGDVQAVDRKTAYEATPGYSAQQDTLNTQRFFTLLIGVLVIGGFFQIQTLQKIPQIGMLKAIGASNTTVAVASVLQIVAVTVLGVAIGTLGTLVLSLGFPPTVPIVFTPSAVVAAVVSLLLIGPMGGLVSIRRSVTVEPLTALGSAS